MRINYQLKILYVIKVELYYLQFLMQFVYNPVSCYYKLAEKLCTGSANISYDCM